jgi:hypothetical protein
MCLALYIASSKSLPLVPWDPEKPAFHVIPLPDDRPTVRKMFRHPHIYYVGSHEGCSCAFNYEHDIKPAVQLRDYLRRALAATDEIEGFACRPDQESLDVKHFVTISPTGVALPEFFLQEGQRLVFCSRKTLLAQRTQAPQATTLKRKPNRRPRSTRQIPRL